MTDTTRTALDLDATRREWTLVDDTKAGQTIIALIDEVERLRKVGDAARAHIAWLHSADAVFWGTEEDLEAALDALNGP
jgi:hypothetical protein